MWTTLLLKTRSVKARSDSDSGPPKKKLKLKLCLNPTPSVTCDDNPVISEPIVESETKRSTIPVLKIPKSKITGLVPINTTVDQIDVKQNESIPVTTPSECSERKAKKIKTQSKIELKSETNESIESKPQMNESIGVSVKQIDVKEENQSIETPKEKPIEETPKPPKPLKEMKPKKREQESAANKLFRQITSGVAVSAPKAKNKRNKSQPLEDMTQITFDEEFSETSLIIETEDIIKPKPKNRRSRPSKTPNDNKKDETKKTKRGKKEGEDKPKRKRNAVITAYMIWSKEHRSKIQQNCPDLDFADVSRKLGEIWQSMPEKEKIAWRRKAQKLITTGSSIISTGKPKNSSLNARVTNTSTAPDSPPLINKDYSSYTSIEDLWEPVGTSPVDVSAHLTLLGESLSIIGQRLKEHSGQIAVSGSLSVLLDSTLCAIGPLLCLTQLHPSLNGCSEETHKKTLDNIAYIMPGI